VYRRGLACYGDVLIKAKVDVEPVPVAEDAVAAVTAQIEEGD